MSKISMNTPLQEDGCAVVPRQRLPLCLGRKRAVDCCSDRRLVCLVIRAKVLGVVGWDDLFCEFAGRNL